MLLFARIPFRRVVSVILALAALVGDGVSGLVRMCRDIADSRLLVSVTDAPGVEAPEDVYLIAHRGLSAVAPENTLPALREAGRYGFFGAVKSYQIILTTCNSEIFVV